jgi:curved DNA-binding protein
LEFKDYYKTLDVSRDATAEEIKKAFRRLARKYHPDVSKETDAEQKMKEVNEANAVLSDPEKRAAYDQLGTRTRIPARQRFSAAPRMGCGF